jgi:hypothetical protein
MFKNIKYYYDKLDNANNQYLQMGSELGIPGATLNIFFHLWPLWMVFKVRRRIHNFKERLAVGISFATICIFMVLYLTGPHVLNVDVLWIVVVNLAFLFVTALKHNYSPRPLNIKILLLCFGVLTIFFAFASFESSFGSKGYKALQNLEWWPYKGQFGYYPYEEWGAEKMRWTARKSATRVKATSNIFGIRVAAHAHNSNDSEGLKFKIIINGQKWDEVHFFNGGFKPLYYYIPHIKNKEVEIRTEVSKTFNPYRMGMSKDNRELGVAVSPITFLKLMPTDGLGFYQWETWGRDHLPGWPQDIPINFRWTGRRATLNLRNKYIKGCWIYLKCAHPDIKSNPVHLIIQADGNKIRELKFVDDLVRIVKLEANQLNGLNTLTIQVNRTWNPKLADISEDGRDLGVAVAILERN